VPQEKLAAVRACCLDADIRGGRSGVYLRKIDGETYLFHYLEKGKDTDPVCFQELTKMMGASTDCFEPMERIFYEEGAADKEPEGEVTRIAMFTGLKPEKEKDYRLLHDNPWPDVIAAIHRANFRHFSIFLEEINGKLYLFGWLEYIGSDIAADDVVNKKDPASIRWWRETDACQIAPPDANGGMWGGMEELMFFGKE
jgi:L-rhamnose mutarotase